MRLQIGSLVLALITFAAFVPAASAADAVYLAPECATGENSAACLDAVADQMGAREAAPAPTALPAVSGKSSANRGHKPARPSAPARHVSASTVRLKIAADLDAPADSERE